VSGDYLWDRSGPRDPDVVRLERLLETLSVSDPAPPLRLPQVRRQPSLPFLLTLTAAAASVVTLVGVAWLHSLRPPGWEVTRVSGAATIAADPIGESARLPVGAWLETDATGRVAIAVAEIGQVQLEPETRVGLLNTRGGDYRLRLERGTMHALIWAPPGQFFVETPSSTAVDLGCAYTMTVDGEGIGTIRVTSGWVGFVWQGREAFIPEGAMCATRPGLGPGTPHFEDTSIGFQAALAMLDLQGGSADGRALALTRVLEEARPRDALTLWHLLTRVDPSERDRVYDRLAELVPPPAGISRDGVGAGNQDMLDRWWDELGLGSTNWWRVWRQEWREGAAR
jgi:hypothetical protein